MQLDRHIEELDLDYVVTDNKALGYELTRRLIQKEHHRIGFLTDLEEVSSSHNRFRGYQRALREAGIEYCPEYTASVNPLDTVQVSAAIRGIMGMRVRPTAFVCLHDYLAKLLAEDLQALDYAIPRDVEVAAVNDEHYPESIGIPMITLSQPAHEVGRQAAEVLLARVADPNRPVDQRELPPVETPENVFISPVEAEASSSPR